MALVSATKASKVLLNTALEVSKDATKKVEEIFPGAAEQACMMASKAANASQKMGEKAGERIIDAAAQAAANPCKAAAVIAGAAGVTMIAAPALVAIPTLGALGFSASGLLVYRRYRSHCAKWYRQRGCPFTFRHMSKRGYGRLRSCDCVRSSAGRRGIYGWIGWNGAMDEIEAGREGR